ncbi:MAG: histidine--tRNA ligase, partial [Alphaproteobacteria bacterium]|nr:histidine--tRNA ligase [Alphaproteobacteria bacterium]
FHQINFELMGLDSPLYDAEILSLASTILKNLGIWDDVVLNINSLANKEDRTRYRSALVDYFTKYEKDLSEDSKNRLKMNPLRILDSKDENDKKISENAPLLSDYYSDESKDYFDRVLNLLNNMGINYEINPKLVRGLDYYDHTIFEFVTDKLGAQGTVLGGGRYNGLIGMMGGPETKAVGFGAGIERLMELVNLSDPDYVNSATIIKIGNIDEAVISQIAYMLRDGGIPSVIAHQDNPGKQFKYADKIKSKLCIIIGEEELKNKTVKIKDMKSGHEVSVLLEDMIDSASNLMRS